jgi:UDP-N-acetylmuramoyl-L-alanyl-D-glutamate--2,6-diaminopimelate ligase
VTLEALLEAMDVLAVAGDRSREIAGLQYDSRRVKPGDAFFALSGRKQDGARFVRDAVRSGAVAVVGESETPVAGATSVRVAEARLALAQAAGRFHGHPSRAMKVIAITGTNGKTTTTWMLESIFRAAGWSGGVIGTTGARFAGETRTMAFTTPESPELQALLAEMRDARLVAVAMEISSHALVQRRAWGLEADVSVFTNLTQDHLDYHGTMDAYLDAKLMLFDGRNGPTRKKATAVVNADDPSAARFIEAAHRGGLRVRTYGTDFAGGHPGRARPGLSIRGIDVRAEGLVLRILLDAPESPGLERSVRVPLMGRYNAFNAAAACSAASSLGIALDAIERGLESLAGVPGRLERVEAGQPFTVVVDYAHTPDALERSLAAMREHTRGRLLSVFGCGGDRDRGKRPIMGEVSARLADATWVTSDNPRSEDPRAIVAEIVGGARGARELHVEVDRRAAIAAALGAARPGDAVLIAGKGHETTQTIGDSVLPFDDREVARELLRGGRRA